MNEVYWWTGFVVTWSALALVVASVLLFVWFKLVDEWRCIWQQGRRVGWVAWRLNRRMKADFAANAFRFAARHETRLFLEAIMADYCFKVLSKCPTPYDLYWSHLIFSQWILAKGGKHGDWQTVDQALAQAERNLK